AHEVQLNTGDAVVFYTDGITEALNKEFQFFGASRLEECIRESGDKSATELAAEIVRRVSQFVGEAPQHDDITLLAMKITE
ncbi:PP2C family protein-serine/threonine phosphatase, partial [Chlamydiota bacterium]